MYSQILNRFKLGSKLNIILLMIILIIIGVNSFVLSQILQNNAEKEIASKASLLIETMGAVRDYTSTQVNPQLAPRLETEEQFLPQAIPAYSAREVFEKLRKREVDRVAVYDDFFFKEATLNPTNLRDKADRFEATIVNKFRAQSSLKELSGFRSMPGGDVFYVARPLSVTKPTCLRCHSTPEVAPKSLITTYGSENGFGWKLNEIVGAQIVSVPASKVINDAHRLQVLIIGVLIVGCLVAIVMLNLFLKTSIIKPLTQMSQWSKQVSTGTTHTDFVYPAKDEIGILARSLNRMKVSMEMALQMLSSNPPES